ncbi:glycosyltransferase family 2 protein [Segetibacter sp. 3557_3]|uniref:glycosyltransferase family 2 protein n=1 Tax=Segetibacter sp. 3557_3 TaxID=2547429 RepID=UPI001404C7B1|nr:glycosyltransferase family 2 protein [Segetibacter sp. 3557_3]
MISVITVSYNSEQYISKTIESVLSQTWPEFEYIIVDDNSTDNSWKIINQYPDSRIKAYRNESNLREYPNRNRAVQLATGRYIIFIDGDDVIYPNAIETFNYYIRLFPESSMFFTREWDPRILYPFQVDPETIYRFEFLDGGIMGGNFTKVLFKRQAILDAGLFPVHISTGDSYMQLKIASKNKGVAINDGLTWWRRRKGNATEKFFKTNRHLAETINYKIAFINHADCPLSKEDKETAKTNIYGLYLRSLFRMITHLKLSDVGYLWKNIKVPREYYRTVFIRSRTNYFNNHNGDNPLHTPVDSNKLRNN